MGVPEGIFTQFVDAVKEVLEEKKDEWGIREIFTAEPTVLYEFPSLGVFFKTFEGFPTDRMYYRFHVQGEIWVYWGNYNAEIRERGLDDLMAAVVVWICKNRTLKGLTINAWPESGFKTVIDTPEMEVVGGRISIIGVIDLVEATDVTFGP